MSTRSPSTARVTLRPVGRDDRAEFVGLARASVGLHRPWIFPPATDAEFATYLERFDGDTALGFVVCLRSSGAIVGYVNISQILRASYQRGVLGYGAFLPHAGRGYMTEALGLALRHAFGGLGLHRLEADIQPANEASRTLVQRLGFRLEGLSPGFINIEGVWQDHERWAVTAEMIALP